MSEGYWPEHCNAQPDGRHCGYRIQALRLFGTTMVGYCIKCKIMYVLEENPNDGVE